MVKKRYCVVVIFLGLAGCGSKDTPSPTQPQPTPTPTVITATLVNRLDVPVVITSGSTTYGSLNTGQPIAITLPPGTKTVSWTSAKRNLSNGSVMQDDLNGATLSLSTNLNTIDISNVVDGVTYFTPSIQKEIADTISIELVTDGTPRCIGWQSGPSFSSFRWGYYRFESSTILRYYKGTRCGVGSSRGWNNSSLLTSLTIVSGLTFLRADVVP
jgi:hypothetical protein